MIAIIIVLVVVCIFLHYTGASWILKAFDFNLDISPYIVNITQTQRNQPGENLGKLLYGEITLNFQKFEQ